MPENLDSLAARIDAGFEHDKRIRALEQGHARVEAVIADLPRMEDRLVRAIEANKPKVWPAASVIVAAIGLVFIVAAAIYGR